MAPERDRPNLDRVREQLRRDDPPEPEYEPDGSGPDLDRVTEQRERLREDAPPSE